MVLDGYGEDFTQNLRNKFIKSTSQYEEKMSTRDN